MSPKELDMDFINLNDISSAPPQLPAGEYHLKIVECVTKQKKGADSKYVNYRVVVQAGPHAGYSFFSIWSLKDTQVWRMKKDFKKMGYNPPGGIPHDADLLGFEGVAVVQEGEDKNDGYDPKNSIARWLGPIA